MTPDQIIAEEVGSTKAAIILAALREKGWEVVRVPHGGPTMYPQQQAKN